MAAMRNRGSLIPLIVVLLLILVLAQNGVLGNLLAGLSTSLSSQNTFGPTPRPPGQPLVSFLSPGNQVLPSSTLPAMYAPTYPPPAQPQPPLLPGVVQTLVPVGAVGTGGQCIVPS